MSIAAQLIVNGIIAGAVYATVAAGFSLIYRVCSFMHFAHGAILAMCAYLFYALGVKAGLPFWAAILLTLPLSGFIGVASDFLFYRPLRKRKASSAVLLIASIALMTFLNSLILAIWGADVKTIPVTNPVFDLFGARVTLIQLVIIGASIVLLALLYLLMTKTRLGKAMRAVADNKAVAETVGIHPETMYASAIFVGSVLAGVSGILLGIEQNLYPAMGFSLTIKGFTGAVIGSLSSVPGAVLGSFILGLIENIGIWFLPSGYKDAISFVLLFVFLLFRPQGLLGKRKREV